MVDYTTWFGISQEVANQLEASQADHQSVASLAGQLWNENKTTIRGWSRTEARQYWRDRLG